MNTLNKRYIWTFFLILLAVMVAAYLFNVYGSSPNPKYYRSDNESIECVTVRDNEGNIIFQTGEPVHVEDEYINENNQHYIVTKVSGSEGIAEIKTQVPQARGRTAKEILYSAAIFMKRACQQLQSHRISMWSSTIPIAMNHIYLPPALPVNLEGRCTGYWQSSAVRFAKRGNKRYP